MSDTVDIRAQLQELVLQTAAAGERELPSLRDLSTRFGISPNTVKKILLDLDGDVRVLPVHGRGFFLILPGDPLPSFASEEDDEDEFAPEGLEPELDEKISPDSSYSPVPEEGRMQRADGRRSRQSVIVVGQLQRATDPTGAPGTRFQLFLQTRQALQSMGFALSWAPMGYDKQGNLDITEIKALELQVAALGDDLAGILLIDPGYGRSNPLWKVVSEVTDRPVVWFHSAPLDPALRPDLPEHCQILEPDWAEAGRALGEYLVANYHPQKVVLLPAPAEGTLPPHLVALREELLKGWGPRWVSVLDWYDVFPQNTAMDAKSLRARMQRMILDTGLAGYELDRFFQSARRLRASLWVCADDLLALAALDHFDGLRTPNEPRPGVLGFGNHAFSLARGLCTVDYSWPSFIERAIEQFSGYGRRNKVARYLVIPAPSDSVYGGNILARSEDWW